MQWKAKSCMGLSILYDKVLWRLFEESLPLSLTMNLHGLYQCICFCGLKAEANDVGRNTKFFVPHGINSSILRKFFLYTPGFPVFREADGLIINELRFVVDKILVLRHLNRTSSLFDKTASGNSNQKEKLNCVASSVDLLVSVFTWQGSIQLSLHVSSEETVSEWLMPWICSWLPFLKAQNCQEEALR